MEFFREELLPSVYLTALKTDKFKTGCLSAMLLTPLDRELAAENAVLPYVLRRGTSSLPDMSAVSGYLDGLYGASVEPVVRKRGEIQCIGFRAQFCEDRFLPGETSVLEDIARLMGDLFLSPNTRGGLLLPAYVDSEREKLAERIDAQKNDRQGYAIRRMLENMCAYETYAVDRFGDRAECENIHYVKLSKDYRALLAASPMEFFYCGQEDGEAVAEILRNAFMLLPRGEINWELGTDIRMNAVEAEPRYFTEEMAVAQGNLSLGYRLGACMEDPDVPAIKLMSTLLGGGVTSKLFANVREKLSLCYYAGCSADLHKGLLIILSGIAFENYQKALDEIIVQVNAIAGGDITPEELAGAKKTLCGSLRKIPDDPTALEAFWLDQTILGLEYGPEEMAALVEDVTAEEISEIAAGMELDAVYFLRGEEAEDE